ncbi:LytTR family DNA-binding domain-containing protein [Leptobacterium sp. I13]|uniref:LytR/AlgR family response regulator transcription factor n=1 Tax=Leptobacterium meishanense TaxID=3128904 RepID=UPI0030EF07C7
MNEDKENSNLSFFKSNEYSWSIILISSVFLALFLLFYQPFGVNNYKPENDIDFNWIIGMFSFGGVLFISLLINERIIKPFINVKRLNLFIPLWILWTLIFSGTINYLYYNYRGGWHDISLVSYLLYLFNFSSIVLFPIIGTTFYFRHRSLRLNYREILYLNKDSSKKDQLLFLSGEYRNSKIAVVPKNILYIESEDNYAAIHYMDNHRIKKYLIRSTLHNLNSNVSMDFIFRCHRSYIVNIFNIEALFTKSNKYYLSLSGVEKRIPVSETYYHKLISVMKKYKRNISYFRDE